MVLKTVAALESRTFLTPKACGVIYEDGVYAARVIKQKGSKLKVKYAEGSTETVMLQDVWLFPDNVKIGTKPLDESQAQALTDKYIKAIDIPQNLRVYEIKPIHVYEWHMLQHGDRKSYMWLTETLWSHFNDHKFSNGLRTCKLKLGRDSGTGFKKRGHWSPRKRELVLSPRLFNGHFEDYLNTLLHECCHQAVTDISQIPTETQNKGHGPVWAGYMEQVGLDPEQYDKTANFNYMSDSEKDQFGEIIDQAKRIQKLPEGKKDFGKVVWAFFKDKGIEHPHLGTFFEYKVASRTGVTRKYAFVIPDEGKLGFRAFDLKAHHKVYEPEPSDLTADALDRVATAARKAVRRFNMGYRRQAKRASSRRR